MIILGISGGLGHEPAACLINDGVIIAMAEEERFVRIKRAPYRSPISATLYCLAEAGINIQDVDVIAIAWDPSLDEESPHLKELLDAFRMHQVFHGKQLPKIVPINHHLAHAAASFYGSGFAEALILVADGQGERVSTTIAYGGRRSIKVLQSFDVSQSIGYFYSAITHYIGLGSGNYGKTMGLAPYGTPVYDFPIIQLTSDGYHMDITRPLELPPGLWYEKIMSQWQSWLSDNFGSPNHVNYSLNRNHCDLTQGIIMEDRFKNVAASAQAVVNELLLHIVKLFVDSSGCRNLVLGGGVALNCSANGAIWNSDLVDKLYVFPAAHDAGGALGAALELAAEYGEPLPAPIEHAYWGPGYDNAVIAEILHQVKISAEEHHDIAEKAADLIDRGAIVGWFQGRMEIGPRALGHRSILANPTRTENLDRVNMTKGREIWRPLAPSMLVDSSQKLLEKPTVSPFMLQAFQVRKDARQLIPAVTHVDGSTRPQMLSRFTSPNYHHLLRLMEKRNGVGAVLNTSFNGPNEPIVCTPFDALRTFFSMGLDALIMENFLILKPGIRL